MQPVKIRNAMLQKFNFPRNGTEVLQLAAGQIVQYHHAVVTSHQFVYRVRTDESRPSRYQIAHPLAPLQEKFGSGQKLIDRQSWGRHLRWPYLSPKPLA